MNWTTHNAKPEIGPDRSSQTRRNLHLDSYGASFGPPRSSGSGFWMVLALNRTIFPVQTETAAGLPRPAANTKPGYIHDQEPILNKHTDVTAVKLQTNIEVRPLHTRWFGNIIGIGNPYRPITMNTQCNCCILWRIYFTVLLIWFWLLQ